MSEALFARLPKFDELESAGSGTARKAAPAQPVQSAEDAARASAEAAFKQKSSKHLSEIEATLGALSQAITTVQQDGRKQTVESVVAIAERLFPELSKKFLSEEIALHLEKMIPESAASVDIKAEPDLAESLKSVIERSNHLSSVCAVTPDASPKGERVTVSWKTGGLTFDFNGLLEACIGHLKTTHPSMGETS